MRLFVVAAASKSLLPCTSLRLLSAYIFCSCFCVEQELVEQVSTEHSRHQSCVILTGFADSFTIDAFPNGIPDESVQASCIELQGFHVYQNI